MATPLLHGAAPRSLPAALPSASAADAAIARVLAAERDARIAVDECALQAEREVQAAREAARAIAARGAERVARAQRHIERELARVATQQVEWRCALTQAGGRGRDDGARLAAAAEALADELTRGALPATTAAR